MSAADLLHPGRHARPAVTLDQLPVRTLATIREIHCARHDGGALKRRLMELGFVPGERVQVLRRVFAGRGPLAVRVGTSTFAMRRLESSLIEVVPA
ncbi:FeoA family protein [uncultured Aquabacterium sp.]|uniref:FeoA family protein n=1 Tax=Aquabacterium sp. TaxID=1872578 RepID=UPI0025EE855F|nr:FeoA family protein [uncultured Aquabacterium sp.]